MDIKKSLMTQVWRLQQSQGLIGIFFWALTLAGVFYFQYIHANFVKWGIVRDDQVFLGTLILFLIFLGTFLVLGFLYDRILRLWKEQVIVAYERNPYTSEYLVPKEVVLFRTHIETLRLLAKENPEALKQVRIMENWLARQISLDPTLARVVKGIETGESAR